MRTRPIHQGSLIYHHPLRMLCKNNRPLWTACEPETSTQFFSKFIAVKTNLDLPLPYFSDTLLLA